MRTSVKISDLDNFTKGYLLAALWTSDESAPSGDYATSGRFEELFPKIAEETILKIIEDCSKFQAQQTPHLEACGLDSARAGHDFWLTRNGHGSGFWDEDGNNEQEVSLGWLTKACKAWGESNLYTGDDGKFYLA